MPETTPQTHLRQVFDDGYAVRFKLTNDGEHLACKIFLAQLRREGIKFSKVLDIQEQSVLIFKPAEE